MKSNKIIIIITFFIGIILACLSGFATYKITLNRDVGNRPSIQRGEPESLTAGAYSLQYGVYKGWTVEYVWDDETEKMIESSKDELILQLNADNTYELSGEKHTFTVVGSDLIVPEFNNTAMLKAIGNNKMELMVGSGVELSYCNE